ncbi:hypothetical protein ACIBW9_39730 [Streptomyces sp. NPDC049541]|uniref:hypothetical protein n=1 Tax=Streptomyces sp. NPDC049541 TaxID=3365594 RepID=UPI0037B984ED
MTGSEDHVAVPAQDASALFGQVLAAMLRHYTSDVPTVVTVGSDKSFGSVLPIPADWPIQHDNAWVALPARINGLLSVGPVLLLPPIADLCDSARLSQGSAAASVAGLFEAAVAGIEAHPGQAPLLMLLPAKYLTSKTRGWARFRRMLARQWQPVFILYSTGALRSVHLSSEVAAVLLCPNTTQTVKSRFFRVPRSGDEGALREDLETLLRLPEGSTAYGYVSHSASSADEGWSYVGDGSPSQSAAVPGTTARPLSLRDLTVSSVFNIVRGFSGRSGDLCEAHAPRGARLLRGRDIRGDGTIAEPDPDSDLWYSDIPERYHLRAGDVLIRDAFLPGRAGAALVRERDLPAVAGNHTIALRPVTSVGPEHMRLILAFLRSSAVERVSPRVVSGLVHLRRQDLESLVLPQPDEALATALDDLDTAGRQLSDWSAEATALARSVFTDARDTGHARQRIIEAGQILRLRAETAVQLDDFGYIVRTRFPYPIALRWRETEAKKSAGDFGPAYDAVLDATEILLCYSALLTAAFAHGAGLDLSSVTALRNKLANNHGGPGLGEWTEVLQEISSKKKRRSLGAEHPLHELGAMLADEEVKAARQRHSARRNNQAHLRRADSVELPKALEESFNDLSLLLNRTRFLADWPLIEITSVTWDAFRGQATLGFRRLMGDHPVVPTESMRNPSSALETGSLYVIDRSHQLHLLRPYLTGRICPICRTWSTFHADKVDNQLVLKSLEHGHCVADSTVTEPLRHVGLL